VTDGVLRQAFERAAGVLAEAVSSGGVPGAACCVAEVGGATVTTVAGVADVATGRPVTGDTPFCLASTTKPIASLVLGALVDEGRLDLDAPVELPPGPLVRRGGVRAPSLREIADHTAGLGVHHRFFYADDRAPVPVGEAIASLARTVWAPGERWSYSNLGYAVLQRELERAGGAPLAELVARVVSGPLGLASFAWGGLDGPVGAAVRYGPDRQPYPGYVTDHPAASEAWCGVEDLARIGLAQLERSLLQPATHDLLVAPSAPRQPDGAAYGLGWVTRRVGSRAQPLWVHAGRMGGVAAHLTLVPDAGVAVAAVADAETDALGRAVAEVVAAVVPGYQPPPAVEGWSTGPAHPRMAHRWRGVADLGGEELPVLLDAAGETMTIAVGGDPVPLVAPHVQPERVAAHANLPAVFALSPRGALAHVDLRRHGDSMAGMITFAQYANERHWRQGDAVSAAVVLDPA
jgi:CubicO group peptidase (beta-lactamase class C family)